MDIEYQLSSIKLKEKSKNGDACSVFNICNNSLQIFLLADGVGSCVGDYKASDTTVNQFEIIFKSKISNQDLNTNPSIIKRIIKETILDVNKFILETEGYFKGMKATFVVLVYEENKKQIHYTSIGDSRIYKIAENKVGQLSKDQVKVVVRRKKDGTPYTQNGSIINAQGVTHVMGAEPLDFKVNTFIIKNSTSFLMASDGFYSILSDSKAEFLKLHNSLDIKGGFKSIVNEVKQNQEDDASAVFFRIESANGTETLAKQREIFNNLEKAISTKNSQCAIEALNDIESNNLKQTFEYYNNAVKKMYASNFNNSEIYQRLIILLKKAKL